MTARQMAGLCEQTSRGAKRLRAFICYWMTKLGKPQTRVRKAGAQLLRNGRLSIALLRCCNLPKPEAPKFWARLCSSSSWRLKRCPGRSKYPNRKVLGLKHYTLTLLGTSYHGTCSLGPSGFGSSFLELWVSSASSWAI